MRLLFLQSYFTTLTARADDESSDSDESTPPKDALHERDSSRTLSTPTQSVAGDAVTRVSGPVAGQSAGAVAKDDAGASATSDDSDSDSSSSDSDAESPAAVVKTEITAAPETPADDVQVTKKRRTSEGGASVPTAVVDNAARDQPGKPTRKVNAPFRRVDPDKVSATIMMDNRYQVKVCVDLPLQGRATTHDVRAYRPDQATTTGNAPIMISSSPAAQVSARRRTRKSVVVIAVGKSRYVCPVQLSMGWRID